MAETAAMTKTTTGIRGGDDDGDDGGGRSIGDKGETEALSGDDGGNCGFDDDDCGYISKDDDEDESDVDVGNYDNTDHDCIDERWWRTAAIMMTTQASMVITSTVTNNAMASDMANKAGQRQ